MKSGLMMTVIFLLMLQSAEGGRGFYSPPLGAIRDIPIDTPLLCVGVVYASETRAAILKCVRTAKHPDFTRIAFEFQNPAQFNQPVIDGRGKFTVVFPNSTTDLPKQSIDKKNGIQTVRSIEFIQKGALLTASIELPFPYFKLRVFSLSSPDRVVIDAYSINPPIQEDVPDKSLDAKAELKESSKKSVNTAPASLLNTQSQLLSKTEKQEQKQPTEPLPSSSNNYSLQIYMLVLLNFLIIVIIFLLSINFLKKKSGINSKRPGKISESLKPIDERIAAINAMINKKFEKNDET